MKVKLKEEVHMLVNDVSREIISSLMSIPLGNSKKLRKM